MITGILLVVLSWLVFLAAISVLGYPAAHLLNKKLRDKTTFRDSIWLGLLIGIIAILSMGIFLPLRSAAALAIFSLLVMLAASSTLLIHRKYPKNKRASLNLSGSNWFLIAALTLALVYLAAAAIGPVTNYDSGLYHLGAIKYVGEYGAIPGLANLYFPFGYNTSLYPIGAFLGNGPWSGNGYRLANGFLILLLVTDLSLRLAKGKCTRSRLPTGTYFLLIATPLTLVPLVSLSDFWVTSPSSDAAVLVLTLISVSYLLDTLTNKKKGISTASVSFAAAVIAFSLRPTIVVFLVVLTLVLLYRLGRVGSLRNIRLLLPATLGILLLVTQSARDYLLSGWLQYPLSLISFNVPWLAADPVWNRNATLGNARNPADIWGSLEGFAWVGPYLSALPNQWEPYFIVGLCVIASVLVVLKREVGQPLPWKTIILAQLPILSGIVAWFFFSPPTFRFGWGVVFSFFFVFIAFLLKSLFEVKETSSTKPAAIRLLSNALPPTMALVLVALVAFNILVRFQWNTVTSPNSWSVGPISFDYRLSPIIEVPIFEQQLESGLHVIVPMESDQCWDNYPLCSPIVVPSLGFRGKEISKGFLP